MPAVGQAEGKLCPRPATAGDLAIRSRYFRSEVSLLSGSHQRNITFASPMSCPIPNFAKGSFDRRSSNKVIRTAPKNIFLEHRLYTQHDERGKKDVSVETGLAELEGQADQIIGKIISAARSGKQPGLTYLEKRTWDKFFCQQWRRLPSMRDTASAPAFISKVLNNFEDKYRPLTHDERDKFNSPQEQSRLLKNAWVQSIDVPGGELLQILGDKGLCVAVIRNPKKSFVIGSTPIIKITPPGCTHLGDPDAEALFPIAYDVIVTPGLSRGEEKLVNEIDVAHIRQLNEAMFEQSTGIAGNSRKLIKSLSRRYCTYSSSPAR